MARGKHAARAATQRYEAANEHIDRLTGNLVDAKARARDNEAAARRLPQVEAELNRLREQVALESYDAVRAAEDRLEAMRVERDAIALRLAETTEKHSEFMRKIREAWPSGIAGFNEFLEATFSFQVVDGTISRYVSDDQARRRIARARRQVAPRSSEWSGGVKTTDVRSAEESDA